MAITTLDEARELVAAGGALLDSVRADSWWDRVDLERLDLGSDDDCTLGQLYGLYDTGLDKLGLSHSVAALYGFAAAYDNECRCVTQYALLTEAWREYIAARREDSGLLVSTSDSESGAA